MMSFVSQIVTITVTKDVYLRCKLQKLVERLLMVQRARNCQLWRCSNCITAAPLTIYALKGSKYTLVVAITPPMQLYIIYQSIWIYTHIFVSLGFVGILMSLCKHDRT